MQDDCESVEMPDMERAKVVVESVVDEQVIDSEETKVRMLVFRRRSIKSAQIQAI